MANADIKLDHGGIGDMLKSGMFAPMCHEEASNIAASVRGAWPDADVVVDDYVTDRNASSVTIREPNAMLRQVRDGILTRAASGSGHEVTSR